MTPAISVGIPFHNAAATLALAIESVLRQDFADFELILLDDGSTDDSLAVARAYLSDPRVRIVSDGQQRRLPARLNQLTQISRALLIARMDADDIMLPARLAVQHAFLASHPGVDVLGSSVYFLGAGRTVLGKRRTPFVRLCHTFGFHHLFHPTMMARKQWMIDNPYSEEFHRCEDLDLWVRSGGGGNIAVLDEALLYYNRFGTFDFRKSITSLRQFERIVGKHRHRTRPLCRLRLIVRIRLMRTAYFLASLARVRAEKLDWKTIPLSGEERLAADNILRSIVEAVDSRTFSGVRS